MNKPVSLHGDVELLDALKDIEGLSGKELEPIIKQALEKVEEGARARAPRDQGDLAGSIRSVVVEVEEGSITGEVGSDRAYSGFVELGTRHQPAQPYIRPTVDVMEAQLEQEIAKEVEKLLDKKGR